MHIIPNQNPGPPTIHLFLHPSRFIASFPQSRGKYFRKLFRIRLRRIIDNYLTARDWQRDVCLGHSALLPAVNY